MSDKITINLDKDDLDILFKNLLKNAFECMHQREASYGTTFNSNKFVNIIEGAIEKNREEAQRIIGEYIIDLVKSDDFKNAIHVEYTAMLARAMLNNISKK